MSGNTRLVILGVLAVVVIGIFIGPSIFGDSEFAVTPNPADVFEKAKQEGKPIFLEFYADW